MPNQRAKNVKLINVPMAESAIREIDAAIKRAGYSDRSTFIREAIVEKLQALKIPVDARILQPPARMGVGGKPTHVSYRFSKNTASGAMNEPSSAKDVDARDLVKRAEASDSAGPPPKSRRSR